MQVDANPGVNNVDGSRTVTGTGTFTVDVLVSAAGEAYAGYQYSLALGWDFDNLMVLPGVLAFNSVTQAPAQTAGMTLCTSNPPLTANDVLYDGCGRSSGTHTYTGVVETVTMHCLQDGTATLHLLTYDDDQGFGSWMLRANGTRIITDLTDADIKCVGTGALQTVAEGAPGGSSLPPWLVGPFEPILQSLGLDWPR